MWAYRRTRRASASFFRRGTSRTTSTGRSRCLPSCGSPAAAAPLLPASGLRRPTPDASAERLLVDPVALVGLAADDPLDHMLDAVIGIQYPGAFAVGNATLHLRSACLFD